MSSGVENIAFLCIIQFLLTSVSFEEFTEIVPLVFYTVIPVFTVVNSWSADVIVVNTSFQQFCMQIIVYFKEEITATAIEYYCQISVFNLIQLVYYSVIVPDIHIAVHLTQLFFHFPVVGERTYINSSNCGTTGTKCVLVSY